jgi:hypothetical protein
MCCIETVETTTSEVLLWVRGDDKAHWNGVHQALQLCSVALGSHNKEERVKMRFMVQNREDHDLYHGMM